jgi:hypothetical protein
LNHAFADLSIFTVQVCHCKSLKEMICWQPTTQQYTQWAGQQHDLQPSLTSHGAQPAAAAAGLQTLAVTAQQQQQQQVVCRWLRWWARVCALTLGA